jgi:hypothetical protein
MILSNLVWPALYILARYYTWWAIGFGLLVECLALRSLSKAPWKKSVTAVVIANLATAVIGYFVLPWATFAWEAALDLSVYQFIGVGTFNIFGWISSVVIMSGLTAFPELVIIRKCFMIPLRNKAWRWWWLANAVSVLLAFITVMIWPVEL